jgi:uncharacterized protein YraI
LKVPLSTATPVLLIAAGCFTPQAIAASTCSDPPGEHVVINVPWEDADGGLRIVDEPHNNAAVRVVIPSAGVGVKVSTCNPGGWCQVRYNCIEGWAYAARYLAPQSKTLVSVIGVSPSDPEGLNVRIGPAHTFAAHFSVPYNATGLIKHQCQASPGDGSQWCLITANGGSGWVAGRFLGPYTGGTSTPSNPTPNPSPPSDDISKACKMFPNLC